MSPISSKQRAHLRSLANRLKPVVHIGMDGVTEGTLRSISEAFHTRELLKVKVQDGAPRSTRDTGDDIVAAIPDVHPVQTIGRTIVLYHRHPDRPEIVLPV